MRLVDAQLLLAELKKRHVQAVLVEELGLVAITILQGVTYPTKYCSVIGDDHSVSWGVNWEYSVRPTHTELAAPAIVRTLPALCFKPKKRERHHNEPEPELERVVND